MTNCLNFFKISQNLVRFLLDDYEKIVGHFTIRVSGEQISDRKDFMDFLPSFWIKLVKVLGFKEYIGGKN